MSAKIDPHVNYEGDNRLRWKCRRGMLELDIMLQTFLDKGYRELDARGQTLFEELLSYEDNPLFELLMNHTSPANPELSYVIKSIQHSLRISH